VHVVGHATGVPALLFDFDGLIVDTERTFADAVIEQVRLHGGSVTYDEMSHLFGTTEAGHLWVELVPRWCEGLTMEAIAPHLAATLPAINDALDPLPGVRELIDSAHALGWRIGLGTGSSRETVTRRLERHGLLPRFDEIVTRADVAEGKPAPDIFLELARRLTVPPADCLVLEDSPHGCVAAIAAGMRVIACPSVVTAGCTFPDGVERVATLLDVSLPAPRD